MDTSTEYYTTYKMNPFNSVFKVFEILHITSPAKALKTKRKRYNAGSPGPEATSFSLQDISIPDPKTRIGVPTGVTVNNTTNASNNVNYVNYNHPRPPPPDPRRDLEDRILRLWRKVWLGLYQADDMHGPFHYERIEALYLGAGLTRTYRVGELKVLNRHFFEYSRNHGIVGLKLYENLSFQTLQSVVEILEAYEREIPNLEKIYSILREGQLELYQEDEFGGYNAPVHHTQRRYLSIAEPLEKRLLHYDARMDVLIMDIHDEAMDLHVFNPGLRKGLFVHEKAFASAF